MYNGQLNANEIYPLLYNMIISQEIFPSRIKRGDDLVDRAKVDGSLFGDTKLYYSVDVLRSKEWTGDKEAADLLAVDRAKDPEVQAITLDKFRMVNLTLDNYLSKRAWSDEGTFGSFNDVLGAQLALTKYVYETTNYNAYFGTTKIDGQTFEVDTSAYGSTLEDEVKAVGNALANVVDKMTTSATAFNQYGHRTKFSKSDLTIVWNTAWLNKFRKVDLPSIFHKDNIIDADIKQTSLNAIYWGAVDTEATSVPADGTYRALYEFYDADAKKDYFAGDVVPGGTSVTAGSIYLSDCADSDTLIDSDSIATIIVRYPPYMSAFEVGTSFFNPRSLTDNRYLIWGENSLENLEGYPFVTLRKKASA